MKKISKQILAVLITVLMLFSVIPVSVFATDNDDVIFIRTSEDLYNIRNNLNGAYVLLNDIDLSEYENWEPIGTSESFAFAGVFDGNGHTISNMQQSLQDVQEENCLGLFGCNIGNIYNLNTKTDIEISSEKLYARIYCGGIVGYNLGKVKNCKVNGTILLYKVAWTSDINIGGIVGRNLGSISNCTNNADITEDEGVQITPNLGGIAGYSAGGNISQCYNTGTVVLKDTSWTTAFVGGIVAWCSNSVVSNCVNKGTLEHGSSGYANYGGIAGGCSSAEITNCYNEGTIPPMNKSGMTSRAIATGSATIFSCYYLEGITKDVNATALTESEILDKKNFVNWDFENIWEMQAGGPVLRESKGEWEGESAKQFPDGYNFETDGWSFHNFTRKATEEDFQRLFKPSKAHLLYLKEGNYGTGGCCYGMALTTIALMNSSPSADSFLGYDGIANINISDISRHESDESRDDVIVIRDDEIDADGNRYYHSYSVSKFIQYGLLTWFASETVERDAYDCVAVYNAVKEYVNGERSYPPIIIITKDKEETGCHAVLGVGIKDNKIIVNDSNNENVKCYLELKQENGEFTGEWSYFDYYGNTTKNYGLIEWVDGSTYELPYKALQYDLDLDEKIEENDISRKQLSDDKMLFFTNINPYGYKIDYSFLKNILIFPENSKTETDNNGYLYWLNDADVNTLTFSDIEEDNAQFMLSDNYSAIYATVSNCSELQLTADDDSENSAIITTSNNVPVQLSFVTTDDNNKCVTATLTGTANGDEVVASETEDGIQVTGLNDITVTYETADGTAETKAEVKDGSTVNITVNDDENTVETDWQDKQPDSDETDSPCKHPDTDHNGICDNCGKDFTADCGHSCHSDNAFVQFFYKIARFFWKLFGMKQYQYCNCGQAHW